MVEVGVRVDIEVAVFDTGEVLVRVGVELDVEVKLAVGVVPGV